MTFANRTMEKFTVDESQNATGSLRILVVSALWQGANDYAFVRAFRRAGHSVRVVSQDTFVPSGWLNKGLRAVRKLALPLLVREFNQALIREAKALKPDLFFVFKGTFVKPEALRTIRKLGTIAINFYPDTGFSDHGPYIPKAIEHYHWVFTTKTAGVDDLHSNYKVESASFLPHAFDPETHKPITLSVADHLKYDCEVSFIGSYSKQKSRLIHHFKKGLPDTKLYLWGETAWHTDLDLADAYQGAPVLGLEYAKAIQASRINLGLLFEGGPSAPQQDKITSRTFEIPAAGGFMLHERTDEAMQYFEEDKECAFFNNQDDLVKKTKYYLEHEEQRAAIAKAGMQRCLSSGYSVDERVKTVLTKYQELSREHEWDARS